MSLSAFRVRWQHFRDSKKWLVTMHRVWVRNRLEIRWQKLDTGSTKRRSLLQRQRVLYERCSLRNIRFETLSSDLIFFFHTEKKLLWQGLSKVDERCRQFWHCWSWLHNFTTTLLVIYQFLKRGVTVGLFYWFRFFIIYLYVLLHVLRFVTCSPFRPV